MSVSIEIILYAAVAVAVIGIVAGVVGIIREQRGRK